MSMITLPPIHPLFGPLLFILCSLAGCDASQRIIQPEAPFESAAKIQSSADIHQAFHRGELVFQMETLKWRNGHRGAVSITYDAPWGVDPVFSLATDAVMEWGLRMDLEVVSDKLTFASRLPIIARMREELLPNGIRFFGHGHTHIAHNTLTYSQAFDSFKRNFDLMQEWGLNPKVYAYPHFSGSLPRILMANKNAGFIAARGRGYTPDDYSICPHDVRQPDHWHYLPSVVMGNIAPGNVRNHARLRPILDRSLDERAWVILTYHSIGYREGWGYYPLDEFHKDLAYIQQQDFWSGNFDSVALYIKERNAVRVEITAPSVFGIGVVPFLAPRQPRSFYLVVRDNLDNAVYNEPLSFELTFNPALQIRQVHLDPPAAGQSRFAVVNDRLRINLLPNERRYRLILED